MLPSNFHPFGEAGALPELYSTRLAIKRLPRRKTGMGVSLTINIPSFINKPGITIGWLR